MHACKGLAFALQVNVFSDVASSGGTPTPACHHCLCMGMEFLHASGLEPKTVWDWGYGWDWVIESHGGGAVISKWVEHLWLKWAKNLWECGWGMQVLVNGLLALSKLLVFRWFSFPIITALGVVNSQPAVNYRRVACLSFERICIQGGLHCKKLQLPMVLPTCYYCNTSRWSGVHLCESILIHC